MNDNLSTNFKYTVLDSFVGYDQEFSYLIKGWVPVGTLGMLFAPSGAFKSFLSLSWAVHIALGIDWNGQRVTKAQVLYIAGEGGVGVPRRIKALANKHNDGELIDGLYRIDHPISMTSIGELNQLITTIKGIEEQRGERFGLIIIDTLARCFGGGDENKAEDMNRFIAACDRLKATVGATVLIVHHSGVGDKERARGSSSLKAACDFEYRIERVPGEEPAFILASTKSKDDKENNPQQFSLQEVPLFIDKDGDEITSLVALNVGQEVEFGVNNASSRSSESEQIIYQIIRGRQQNGHLVTREVIRDDLRAQGLFDKNYLRVLQRCIEKGTAIQKGEHYYTSVVKSP